MTTVNEQETIGILVVKVTLASESLIPFMLHTYLCWHLLIIMCQNKLQIKA